MCSYVLLSETLIVNKTTVFKCIKCVISDCYLFTFTGLAKSTVVYIVIVKYKKCWHTRTVNVHGVCPRNVLKYLSKEDEQVSFYCRESALSFNYRARVGARRTPTFRFSDPFVLEHLSTTGCYRNYIARDYGDSVVSMQLYRGFKSGGPDGACKYCFTFVSSCRNECGKPCMFMDDLEWESHSLSGVEFRGFTCLCPDLSSSAITGMIFMTSYCLKSSNMTVSRRAFGNSGEYLKELVLQWMDEC